MSVHVLESITTVPVDLPTCWSFFSDPGNLARITPPSMGFEITSGAEGRMYPGQIITYKVKPLLGIPVTWVTEITQVREQEFFIDEQRIGPYRFWHHKHFFRAVEGGVEMTDVVHYSLPFEPFSLFMVPLVKSKLRGIFEYREKVISRLFSDDRKSATQTF